MAIPDFQTIMLPLLKYFANVDSATPEECTEFLDNEKVTK